MLEINSNIVSKVFILSLFDNFYEVLLILILILIQIKDVQQQNVHITIFVARDVLCNSLQTRFDQKRLVR